MAADHELEAVREARVIGLALGQRADLLGVVADERGINQRGLAQLVVELEEELASAPAVLGLDAVGAAELAQVLDGRVHVHVLAHHLRRDLGEGHRAPGAAHVYLLALVRDDLVTLLAAADLARDGLEQALGEALHPVEIGVGAVGLHRGELGVVREVHALVAELAANLKDALHTAHNEALERQLGGNAQVEVAVERIEVRDEGLCVGAAENGVHHGSLDLHVAVGLHVTANQADDGAALAEHVADLGVHDEVDVALAIADLAVGEAVELLGQRSQRLGEKRELGRRNGELAATSAQHAAGCVDDVAKVQLAEKPPALLAQVVHAAEELNLTRDVFEDDKGDLALTAKRADAAGNGDYVLGVLAVGKVRIVLLELSRVGRDLASNGIGVHAHIDERLATGTALGPLVIRVVLARLGLIGHCCSSCSRASVDAHVVSRAWSAIMGRPRRKPLYCSVLAGASVRLWHHSGSASPQGPRPRDCPFVS